LAQVAPPKQPPITTTRGGDFLEIEAHPVITTA